MESEFDSFLFLGCVIPPEEDLPEHLQIDGDPVNWLWVVPIFRSECEFIRAQGPEPFVEKMQQADLSIVFDLERKPLV